MLVKFTSAQKDEWNTFLDTCVFTYNMAKHESSLHTPFELMFGRKAIFPIDINIEKKVLKNFWTIIRGQLLIWLVLHTLRND